MRQLNKIEQVLGKSLAHMAIAWALRDRRVTSALIGARTVVQLDNSLDAINRLDFTQDELKTIDQFAQEGNVDLWRSARETMQ